MMLLYRMGTKMGNKMLEMACVVPLLDMLLRKHHLTLSMGTGGAAMAKIMVPSLTLWI